MPLSGCPAQSRSACQPVAFRRHSAAHRCPFRQSTRAEARDTDAQRPSEEGLTRRQLLPLSAAAALAASLINWAPSAVAEPGANPVTGTREQLTLAEPTDTEGFLKVEDATLAYRFAYPVKSASGRAIPIIFSRRPERYSSAAPLSPDARQRIVCSLVSLADSITYTVTVGPAAGVLKQTPPQQWRPRDVAETVLIDRSTARTTQGQRVALNNVESASAKDVDGHTYYVYEHLSQGSPTDSNPSQETYRHAVAATTTREGTDGVVYLYTLNLSCPEKFWSELQPEFQKSVDSFRLVKPTKVKHIARVLFT